MIKIRFSLTGSYSFIKSVPRGSVTQALNLYICREEQAKTHTQRRSHTPHQEKDQQHPPLNQYPPASFISLCPLLLSPPSVLRLFPFIQWTRTPTPTRRRVRRRRRRRMRKETKTAPNQCLPTARASYCPPPTRECLFVCETLVRFIPLFPT